MTVGEIRQAMAINRAASLLAENQRLEAEVAKRLDRHDAAHQAIYNAYSDEVARLRAALVIYGRHLDGCDLGCFDPETCAGCDEECSCGLSAALGEAT